MSEIEKMYENAGIKPLSTCNSCNRLDEYWSNGTYCYTCKDDKDNDECGIADYVYPPFTAEKQIELIKWLGKNKNGFGFFNDGTEGLSCHCNFNWEWFRKDFYAENFDNALAGLTNSLWQDLTEEEKQQIKEILNG